MAPNKCEVVRFDSEDLPELATEVAITGSEAQQEVGGPICLGVAAGVAIYMST